MATSLIFCSVTFLGSLAATRLPEVWYGIGVVMGAFCGWTFAYFRIRFMEKHLDAHIFCRGSLLKPGMGTRPPGQVYTKNEKTTENGAVQRL